MKYIIGFLLIVAGAIGAVLGAFIIYMLVLMTSTLFVDTNRIYDKHSRYFRWLLNSSTFISLFTCRVRLHTKGLEKIPQGTRFLLVSNHRSKFDPITTWYILRKYDLAFISKDANFHIPFWGRIIRRCCFLSISRENPRKAMETIMNATSLIKNDQVSMGVYPEGTRNYEPGLLPFHNGVFKIAQKANVPVLICGIKGTEKIKDNFPLHRSDVYFEVLEVLPPEKVKAVHCTEVGTYARDLILSYVESNKEENR